MRKTVMTAFAFAAIAATPMAQAKTASTDAEGLGPVRTTTIEYKDLDLTSVAGKARFERRIAGAMRHVCTDEADIGRNSINHSEEDRCKASVREQVAAALPAYKS